MSGTTQAFSIDDLRRRPEFASVVADRVWRAWWKPKGRALPFVEGLVRRSLDGDPIPLTLVAHEERRNEPMFLGTAAVIAADLDVRPQYAPWVAAVWVDPAHRAMGIGSALVRAGAGAAHALGFDPVYLCALPARHGFYRRLGWRVVETEVTDAGLAVFRSP